MHDDLVDRDFTADGTEPAVADRHHRAPHRRGQALPLRDQGRLLQPDRRLLDRRPDDRRAGRRRPAQRDRAAATPSRHDGPLRPRVANSGPRPSSRDLTPHGLIGSMGRVGACGDNAAMESFFALLQKNVLNRQRWAHPRTSCASRSSPGSNGPTTADAANDALGRLTPIEFETINRSRSRGLKPHTTSVNQILSSPTCDRRSRTHRGSGDVRFIRGGIPFPAIFSITHTRSGLSERHRASMVPPRA